MINKAHFRKLSNIPLQETVWLQIAQFLFVQVKVFSNKALFRKK